jgi:hypothetical protein
VFSRHQLNFVEPLLGNSQQILDWIPIEMACQFIRDGFARDQPVTIGFRGVFPWQSIIESYVGSDSEGGGWQ